MSHSTLIVRAMPRERSCMSITASRVNTRAGSPPAILDAVGRYIEAVSMHAERQRSSQRSVTRCFNWRKPGSFNRSPQFRLAGEHHRQQLFGRASGMFANRRTSSSRSAFSLWASSITSAMIATAPPPLAASTLSELLEEYRLGVRWRVSAGRNRSESSVCTNSCPRQRRVDANRRTRRGWQCSDYKRRVQQASSCRCRPRRSSSGQPLSPWTGRT